MNPAAHDSPLGKQVAGSAVYDADLLFPIPRAAGRGAMGLAEPLPFHGVDIWNAWELSWLDLRGKPQVAIGEFRIPASSPNLIESKSFKLYLNSLNQTRFADADAVRALLLADLSAAAGMPIDVVLLGVDPTRSAPIQRLDGECIDDLDIDIDQYGPPQAGFLGVDAAAEPATEVLLSHLLKSNCPVTGQPDWASVQIRYHGKRIDRAGLLRYLVSYRNHDDFHEQCVERIFRDLLARCAPQQLTVHARYTRRGGLDINPWRSNVAAATADNPRLQRQ
ncbi:MAG: NADPH-dependent 7-cyano-7-deazaguanine reductase QueF [Dokdonella sp.]|uniref:NADPH-dependent 7-cyano-7-deazaguanine reductase QueF n=1 Tax=Dokdonella sp. TaxID=2291710 RepID=UPI002CB9843F|nr:NADPH-dependent 7-cyano-7-deazaguanine reductase QueF [Xanthomonadales bacterium]MBK7210343.1 NADPH-dependent 7-cyano-7-deazaguanine reductase QueF [Xanthomonadales bacterium]MBL0223796.1 NADPH-dependent 7-cyano-7-deazaguanine reductase QueF [Xanthomonadales bacterium]HQV73004.1 NADPH-dependent 7-cyano-7-deazaguanine reductase QueF [Dokdonella sp.]HQW77286.1 NADPH-dependent 7-cyano-7-deazaguanine reductase QueF [Dokdonella sp.]